MTGGHNRRYSFEAGPMSITQCYAEARITDYDVLPDNGTHIGPLEFSVSSRSAEFDTATMCWSKVGRAIGIRISRS